MYTQPSPCTSKHKVTDLVTCECIQPGPYVVLHVRLKRTIYQAQFKTNIQYTRQLCQANSCATKVEQLIACRTISAATNRQK